jgi:hypothetical protein
MTPLLFRRVAIAQADQFLIGLSKTDMDAFRLEVANLDSGSVSNYLFIAGKAVAALSIQQATAYTDTVKDPTIRDFILERIMLAARHIGSSPDWIVAAARRQRSTSTSSTGSQDGSRASVTPSPKDFLG